MTDCCANLRELLETGSGGPIVAGGSINYDQIFAWSAVAAIGAFNPWLAIPASAVASMEPSTRENVMNMLTANVQTSNDGDAMNLLQFAYNIYSNGNFSTEITTAQLQGSEILWSGDISTRDLLFTPEAEEIWRDFLDEKSDDDDNGINNRSDFNLKGNWASSFIFDNLPDDRRTELAQALLNRVWNEDFVDFMTSDAETFDTLMQNPLLLERLQISQMEDAEGRYTKFIHTC